MGFTSNLARFLITLRLENDSQVDSQVVPPLYTSLILGQFSLLSLYLPVGCRTSAALCSKNWFPADVCGPEDLKKQQGPGFIWGLSEELQQMFYHFGMSGLTSLHSFFIAG